MPTFPGVDFLDFDSLLSDEDRLVRKTARQFVDNEVLPIIERHNREATFPMQLLPQLAALGFFGANLSGYGCPGMSNIAYGQVMQELERGDSALRSFVSVQSALVMYPIHEFGSPAQKEKWLRRLQSGRAIGCFGLTEPQFGSNPGGMLTRAVRRPGHYVLNGEKMWITNGSIADVAVIWAKDEDDRVRLWQEALRPLRAHLVGAQAGRVHQLDAVSAQFDRVGQHRVIDVREAVHRRLAVFLQVENSSQINMGPSHHLRFMRDFQGALKIISSALHVRVVGGDFRQNKKCPALVFVLLVQRLLRQLLRAFRVARRKPLLGRDQQLGLLRTREMQQFGIGGRSKRHLGCALSFLSQIDAADQIAIRVAEAGWVLLKPQQRFIKISRQDEALFG